MDGRNVKFIEILRTFFYKINICKHSNTIIMTFDHYKDDKRNPIPTVDCGLYDENYKNWYCLD